MRRALQIAAGVAVSAMFVWLIVRSVSIGAIVDAMRDVRPVWMAAAVGCFVVGYLCRIWRWRLMLATENSGLSLGRCAVPFMISIGANNVLPFRTGDALRAFAFPAWLGVPTASVLASLVAERLMDLFVLLLFLGAALVLFRADTQVMGPILASGGVLLLTGAVLVAALLFTPQAFEMPLQMVFSRLRRLRTGLADTLSAGTRRLFDTLRCLTRGRRGAWLLAWSVLAWAMEACVFYAVARAVPAMSEPVASWLAMPVGTLSTLLPSTPGYVGTFHYFVMVTTQTLGNTEAAAAAFAVLVHLTLWVSTTMWGAAAAVYWILTRTAK